MDRDPRVNSRHLRVESVDSIFGTIEDCPEIVRTPCLMPCEPHTIHPPSHAHAVCATTAHAMPLSTVSCVSHT